MVIFTSLACLIFRRRKYPESLDPVGLAQAHASHSPTSPQSTRPPYFAFLTNKLEIIGANTQAQPNVELSAAREPAQLPVDDNRSSDYGYTVLRQFSQRREPSIAEVAGSEAMPKLPSIPDMLELEEKMG